MGKVKKYSTSFEMKDIEQSTFYVDEKICKIDFEKANMWYRKTSVQGDALAIGNLGMLYVRGQGVKENKVAGVALLIWWATLDPSPENLPFQDTYGRVA